MIIKFVLFNLFSVLRRSRKLYDTHSATFLFTYIYSFVRDKSVRSRFRVWISSCASKKPTDALEYDDVLLKKEKKKRNKSFEENVCSQNFCLHKSLVLFFCEIFSSRKKKEEKGEYILFLVLLSWAELIME